jgi:KaiC/GvpD/RAD55 family RecA-like ATPase
LGDDTPKDKKATGDNPKGEKTERAVIISEPVCSICGGSVKPEETSCSRCGTAYKFVDKEEKNKIINEFRELPGLGRSKAKLLFNAGYASIEDLKGASVEDFKGIEGFGNKLADKIFEHFHGKQKAKKEGGKPDAKPAGEEKALESWLRSDSGEDDLESWLDGESGAVAKATPKPQAKKDAKPEAGTGTGTKPTGPAGSGEPGVPGEKAKPGTAPEPDAEAKPAGKPGDKKDQKEGEEDMDLLEAWVSGEEDALDAWLTEEPLSEDMAKASEEVVKDIVKKQKEMDKREKEMGEKLKSIETLKATLEKTMKDVDTGEFDFKTFMEEHSQLKEQLHNEKEKNASLEAELDQVKKGSIAVIKYVKAQQVAGVGPAAPGTMSAKEVQQAMKGKDDLIDDLKAQIEEKLQDIPEDAKALKQKEIELIEKENQMKAWEHDIQEREKNAPKEGAGGGQAASPELIKKLEEAEEHHLKEKEELTNKMGELSKQLEEQKVETKQLKDRAGMAGKSDGEIDKELQRKIREVEVKEKSLAIRESENQSLRDKLALKEDELVKLKEPLAYKEEELLRRDEDLVYREQQLIEERKRFDHAKKEAGSMEGLEAKRQLESLKQDISKKELEIKAKDKYLSSKEEELRLRERGLIGEEIEAREEDRNLELQIKKVKTGTTRLDDLLLGGIPFGSNVAVYGPPFVGKEVLISVFVAEGLKKGVPVIWLITDKSAEEIREEMLFVLSGYEEYEERGLVKYVDSYAAAMGGEMKDPYSQYVEDPTDYNSIIKHIDTIAKEYKEKHEYYRLAVRSVSTLIAYLDPNTTFRFLQPFSGRRKRDKAVSMYAIEKGMHSEQEIQLIGHLMDGSVDFKVDQLKTFVAVKGIGDVQSRDYIGYTHAKTGLNIGSFALEHIR